MHVDDFDFDLPQDRIAQHPVVPRDAARLLHVGQTLADRAIGDLPELLRPGDLLVVNDTRVLPSRLHGRRGEANVSVTLHKQAGIGTWRAFARPAKRLRAGDTIVFADDLRATVSDRLERGEMVLDFDCDDSALMAALHAHGQMPLPPYIRRDREGAAEDRDNYQTVFARRDGAVAAPTASLHFTDALLRHLAERGIERATLTLHVGAGTFLPIQTDDPRGHAIHSEWGELTEEMASKIAATRDRGGRVVAVGTTACRLLEAASDGEGGVKPFIGETDLYILPGFRFRVVDLLLTNFHLPKSTLFMLVCAFAGKARMLAAYDHAVRSGYRFYSYGDACLLEPAGVAAPSNGEDGNGTA